MIGQEKNIKFIDKCFEEDRLPQSIIIAGGRGNGKKLLAKYIAEKTQLAYSELGIKVEDVREAIKSAQKYPSVYVFPNADNMSTNAKNALLKITEEPPKDSYFVMTVEDDSTVLDTLRSRSCVIQMQPYTKEELKKYATEYLGLFITNDNQYLLDIATSPRELQMLVEYGKNFTDYVHLVLDNLLYVEPANAFKSAEKLALKNEEDKYDLVLFFRTILVFAMQPLKQRGNSKTTIPSRIVLVTCTAINQCYKVGANKTQIYDNWVFDMRRITDDFTGFKIRNSWK